MLTRDQLLSKRAEDFPLKAVEVPEYGGSVYARTISAGDFLKLSEKVSADAANAYTHWVIAGIVDADGKPLFSEADAESIKAMKFSAVERMVTAVQAENFVDKEVARGKSPAPTAD